jgi:ApaG protein
MYHETTQGIEVEVTPEFLPEESTPDRFIFAYHIEIKNRGETQVQLMSRHWVITDGFGAVHEVKGDGVVGMQPKLSPGESHKYSSFCPLPTPTGNMRGSFQMVNNLGAAFEVKIPLFFLRDLRSVH